MPQWKPLRCCISSSHLEISLEFRHRLRKGYIFLQRIIRATSTPMTRHRCFRRYRREISLSAIYSDLFFSTNSIYQKSEPSAQPVMHLLRFWNFYHEACRQTEEKSIWQPQLNTGQHRSVASVEKVVQSYLTAWAKISSRDGESTFTCARRKSLGLYRTFVLSVPSAGASKFSAITRKIKSLFAFLQPFPRQNEANIQDRNDWSKVFCSKSLNERKGSLALNHVNIFCLVAHAKKFSGLFWNQ